MIGKDLLRLVLSFTIIILFALVNMNKNKKTYITYLICII